MTDEYAKPPCKSPVRLAVILCLAALGCSAADESAGPEALVSLKTGAISFEASDDATIKRRRPSRNYHGSRLEADGKPHEEFLLKFDLSGIGSQTIESATLHLYNRNGSDSGGEFFAVGDHTWSGETVTWETAPSAGKSVASLGKVRSGNWYAVDLSSHIVGDGTYSFRVASASSNGADYGSRTYSRPPLLEVVVAQTPTCDQETCSTCEDRGDCEGDDEEEAEEAEDIPSDAFYVSPTGDDSNKGSLDAPWKTLGVAFSRLVAGNTLVVRGGTYNETNLDLRAKGSSSAPITIRNFPGEAPIANGSFPEFRIPGNDAWELVDADIDLYRSKQSFGDDVFTGKIFEGGKFYNLVAYSDMDADGWANINSTEENVSDEDRYVGPGIYNRNGQIYIRLTPLGADALHGRSYNVPSIADPRQNALYIGDDSTVVRVSGEHIVFDGVDVGFSRIGFRLGSDSHHISIKNLTTTIPMNAVQMDDCHDITIDNVYFDGGFPAWLAWTDLKGGDGQSQPARHWNNKTAGVSGASVSNLEIKNSHFDRVFDGGVLGGHDIHVHHNRYTEVLDDMIQLASSSYNVEIAHNEILGAGPSHNGKGSSSAPGTKYVHHNLINNDVEMLWGKYDPDEILRTSYSGWHGAITFSTHSSRKVGDGDPWQIYYNTILHNGQGFSSGCGMDQWTATNSTGVAHTVYNNILVETGGGVLADEMSTDDGFQIYDGNLYFRATPSTEPLWDDVDGSDFDTLRDFLNSSSFQASKDMLDTGWESNGIEADPRLDEQKHPSDNGPAAMGAILLPSHFPGPRHVYRGALPPR